MGMGNDCGMGNPDGHGSQMGIGLRNPRGNGKFRLGLGNHCGNRKRRPWLRNHGGKSSLASPSLPSTSQVLKILKIPGFPGLGWDKPSRDRIFPSQTSHSQAGGGDEPGTNLRENPFFQREGKHRISIPAGQAGPWAAGGGQGRSDPPGRAGSRLSGCPGAVWARRGRCPRTHRSG